MILMLKVYELMALVYLLQSFAFREVCQASRPRAADLVGKIEDPGPLRTINYELSKRKKCQNVGLYGYRGITPAHDMHIIYCENLSKFSDLLESALEGRSLDLFPQIGQ